MNHDIQTSFDTHILIRYADTKEVLGEGKNAIHPQNMSRVIARALANEPNSIFHRIAFGNGGTYTDAASNVVFNPPNDGISGGWEARLYNETYSEVVDENNVDFKTDPGSADVNNVRIAGGASPADDPEGGGVTSVEVGRKSNIVVTVVINENEPAGQVPTQNVGPIVEDDETYFMFDEIGLYSPGRPAKSTSGYSTVNVGTEKTSTNTTNLTPDTNYNLPLVVDGVNMLCVIHTPASGTGSAGSFTYGDICEGINSGAWIISGDDVDEAVLVYITDRSGGAYPSILGMQSYGYLTFESKTTGAASTVELTCNTSDSLNFFNVITNGVCGNVNLNAVAGVAAGVANDPVNPANERERLLTHFIFDPILKSKDRAIEIVYTLTVSVGRTTGPQVTQETGTPLPTPSPTPTPTTSVTPTVTPTISVTPTITPTISVTPTATPEPEAPSVNMNIFSFDGVNVADNPDVNVLEMTSDNGAVTVYGGYIQVTGIWEEDAGLYNLTITDWDQDASAEDTMTGTFSAAGRFGGDYDSDTGGDPFLSPEWSTNSGLGLDVIGINRIGANVNFGFSGSFDVYGTAIVSLWKAGEEDPIAQRTINWSGQNSLS